MERTAEDIECANMGGYGWKWTLFSHGEILWLQPQSNKNLRFSSRQPSFVNWLYALRHHFCSQVGKNLRLMEPKKNNNIWTILIAVMLQFEVWKYSIESYYKPFRVHLSLWAVTKSQCKWYSNLHKRKKCDCRKKKVASVWLNTIVSAKLSSALYATLHKKEILNKYNCLLLNANDNDTDWTMSASWTAETFL